MLHPRGKSPRTRRVGPTIPFLPTRRTELLAHLSLSPRTSQPGRLVRSSRGITHASPNDWVQLCTIKTATTRQQTAWERCKKSCSRIPDDTVLSGTDVEAAGAPPPRAWAPLLSLRVPKYKPYGRLKLNVPLI